MSIVTIRYTLLISIFVKSYATWVEFRALNSLCMHNMLRSSFVNHFASLYEGAVTFLMAGLIGVSNIWLSYR
jgi:hypothetical protein